MMGRKKLSAVKAEVAALLGRLPGQSPRTWLDKEIESAEGDDGRDVETLEMLCAALDARLESPKPRAGPRNAERRSGVHLTPAPAAGRSDPPHAAP